MAPHDPLHRLALVAVLAVGLAGCTPSTPQGSSPDPDVTVGSAGSSATGTGRPTSSPTVSDDPTGGPPTPPAGGATIAPPDLSDEVVDCDAVDGPCEYGDDPELDRLWDACEDGDGVACDRLYYDSGFDTRYEQFGNTCGDRDLLVPCPEDLQ